MVNYYGILNALQSNGKITPEVKATVFDLINQVKEESYGRGMQAGLAEAADLAEQLSRDLKTARERV